jgi:hypothetical protein
VSTNYYVLPKIFEEEMCNPLKGKKEKQLPKSLIYLVVLFPKKIVTKEYFKKDDV